MALHVLEAASKQHLCLVPGCFDVPLAFAVKQTLQAEDAFCSHHQGDAVFRSQKQVQAWLEDPEDQLLGPAWHVFSSWSSHSHSGSFQKPPGPQCQTELHQAGGFLGACLGSKSLRPKVWAS